MATKRVQHPDIGTLVIQKRKNSKHIRLSVDYNGTARVSVPFWAPYKSGLLFALSKKEWLQKLQDKLKPTVIFDGMSIGKAHRVSFNRVDTTAVKTRVNKGTVSITVPPGLDFEDTSVQQYANKACIRALKKESETLLSQRLQQLSAETGLAYRSFSVKKMKSRWGSCSSNKDIVLNIYLMQLPWELIDYVILHELTHTEVMQHGPKFWTFLGQFVKNLPDKRKQIKIHRPQLVPRVVHGMSYEA